MFKTSDYDHKDSPNSILIGIARDNAWQVGPLTLLKPPNGIFSMHVQVIKPLIIL